MPKIRINEIDNTGRVQASAISNVVYVPVRFNTHVEGETKRQLLKTDTVGRFNTLTLFTSATEFKNAAGETGKYTDSENLLKEVDAIISADSLGYQLCVHLLNIGFHVLVEALADTDTPSWNLLEDKSLYDIRFLTLGSLVEGATYTNGRVNEGAIYFNLTDSVQSMVSTAAKRGDCIALVNADETDPSYDYSVASVREDFGSLSDGEYAAAFSPWFYTKNSDFKSTADDEKGVKIPAAFGYLFAYANATKNNPEWYAIAGFERGIIPELSDVCHSYTTAEVEVLQGRSATEEVDLDDAADNVGYAINPICYVRPAGNIIYGNRTLRVNDASKKLIASSFLNIRNGLSAIKKVMYEASRKYTFEQNTETLWINFQSYITPLLDKMQAGNGILGYTFIRQKTDAKARLKARLNLIPVEAVEDFDLEVRLADDLTVSE